MFVEHEYLEKIIKEIDDNFQGVISTIEDMKEVINELEKKIEKLSQETK